MGTGIYFARNLGKRELQEKNKDGRYKPIVWDPVCQRVVTRTMHLKMAHNWTREQASAYFRETGAFYHSMAARTDRLAASARVEQMGRAYMVLEAQKQNRLKETAARRPARRSVSIRPYLRRWRPEVDIRHKTFK